MNTSSKDAALREQIRRERSALREAVIERLRSEGELDLAAKLDKCGQPLVMLCQCCGTTKVCHTRCDLKWCPSCQHALAARTVERYRALCEHAQWPLSVTLTVRNYEEVGGIRQLRRAWGKLRRLRWFRACVKGGAVAFEVTRKKRSWHYHAHCFFDCRWLAVSVKEPRRREDFPQRAKQACTEVAEQWSLCAGRKSSVFVRRVFKRDGGDITASVREQFKYACKGSDLADRTKITGKIGPLIVQLGATRLITSFGTFFGKAPKRKKVSLPCEHCHSSEWLPEAVVLATSRDQRTGLTRSQHRRR